VPQRNAWTTLELPIAPFDEALMVPSSRKGANMDLVWGTVEKSLVLSIVYSLVGVLMFSIGFLLIAKLSPFSIRKEIEEDQNIALAVIIAAVILGLSIIIAAAISG
jgi:hypothetical protein